MPEAPECAIMVDRLSSCVGQKIDKIKYSRKWVKYEKLRLNFHNNMKDDESRIRVPSSLVKDEEGNPLLIKHEDMEEYKEELLRMHKDIDEEGFELVEAPEDLKPIMPKVPIGGTLYELTSIGKRIIFTFKSRFKKTPNTIILSNVGMAGEWKMYEEGDKNIQIEIIFRNKKKAVFCSRPIITAEWKVITSEDVSSYPPCIINNQSAYTDDYMKSLLERHSRANICRVLLNQSIISGIGNYLKSDILGMARINPHLTCGDLNDDQIKRLTESIKYVADLSYGMGGYGISGSHYKPILYEQTTVTNNKTKYHVKREKIYGRLTYYIDDEKIYE